MATTVTKSTILFTFITSLHLSTRLTEGSDNKFMFDIYRSKSQTKHTEFSVYSSKPVRHVTLCADECTRNFFCLAFFAEQFLNPRSSNKLLCHFMNKRPSPTFLSDGDGTFGIRLGFSNSILPMFPQNIVGSRYLFSAANPAGRQAMEIYDCSSSNPNMTTIALLFDGYDLPPFSQTCASTLCQQVGLSATLISIDEVLTKAGYAYEVTSICPRYDEPGKMAICDGEGKWTYPGPSPYNVGCIPTTCFRYDSDGNVVYNGGSSLDSVQLCRWPHLLD